MMPGSKRASIDIATDREYQVINKMERTIHMESHVGANVYRVKMGSKTKMYHVNMLKNYIAREPEVNVVPTGIKDGATLAAAGVITKVLTQSWGSYQSSSAIIKRKGPRRHVSLRSI